MNNALKDVAVGLVSGAIKVVDLSVTLRSETPILQLKLKSLGGRMPGLSARKKYHATTSVDHFGIGTTLNVESIPARILMLRFIG